VRRNNKIKPNNRPTHQTSVTAGETIVFNLLNLISPQLKRKTNKGECVQHPLYKRPLFDDHQNHPKGTESAEARRTPEFRTPPPPEPQSKSVQNLHRSEQASK
jgi:hypothetical protein